jgi:hypothetical protein
MEGNDRCRTGFNFGGSELVPESEVLPIPDSGKGLPVDPEVGYALKEIADDTWALTDGLYVCMFVVTTEGVVLFDAPPSLAVRPTYPTESWLCHRTILCFSRSFLLSVKTGGYSVLKTLCFQLKGFNLKRCVIQCRSLRCMFVVTSKAVALCDAPVLSTVSSCLFSGF